MPLAIFFEIFWLDLIPIGGYIPPMASFPYLLLLSLAGIFGWSDAASLTLPLMFVLPLAYFVAYIEQYHRDFQKKAFDRLMAGAVLPLPLGALSGKLVLMAAVQLLSFGLLLFLAAHIGLRLLFSWDILNNSAQGLPVTWQILFVIAAIGALLSLRIKKAYLVFTLAMAGFSLLYIFQ